MTGVHKNKNEESTNKSFESLMNSMKKDDERRVFAENVFSVTEALNSKALDKNVFALEEDGEATLHFTYDEVAAAKLVLNNYTSEEMYEIFGTDEIDIANELKAMEEEGIICGYHTLIDWEKTNIEKVSALIEVRVTPQRGQGFDSIAERIYKYPEVNSVYLISGGYDLLVSLEGKSLKEVSSFVTNKLSTLDSVLSTATHFILKKYKDHGTIMTKKYEDERMKVTP